MHFRNPTYSYIRSCLNIVFVVLRITIENYKCTVICMSWINHLYLGWGNKFSRSKFPASYFSFFKFFKDEFIYLNWRIITLQYCVGFCHTSTWIGHRDLCAPPSWTHLPCPRALTGCPASCIKLAPVIYFTYGNIHLSMLFCHIFLLRKMWLLLLTSQPQLML